MVTWWPFGRKRRKTHSPPASLQIPPNITTQPPSAFALANPPLLVEKEPIVPHSNASAAPVNPPSQSHTPKKSRRPVSDSFTVSPLYRKGIATSPHLRPVPESDLNRSPTLRTPKSTTDSTLLRRLSLSGQRRSEDRKLKEQLQRPTSPTIISEQEGGVPGTLGRAGSKRKRVTSEGSPLNRISAASMPPLNLNPDTMASVMDKPRFDVGAISIFSPHPTIRYSMTSQPRPSGNGSRPGTAAIPLSKQTLQQSKTVDDLADGLDAATLRKLMERDQRRRDRKRKAEEEQAQKRLEQYAKNTQELPNVTQRLTGRVSPDAPAEAGPSTLVSDPSIHPNKTHKSPLRIKTDEPQDPFADPDPEPGAAQVNILASTPMNDKRISFDDEVYHTAQTIRYSQASLSPPASPRHHARNMSSLSQIPDVRSRSMQDISNNLDANRPPEGSGGRTKPLASLFRRSFTGLLGGDDKASEPRTEGSFSNTSREFMSRQLPPPHLRGERPTSPKSTSNLAAFRAKSRFIEDLPEFPVSSPDILLQPQAVSASGEAQSAPIPITHNQSDAFPTQQTRTQPESLAHEVPVAIPVTLSQSLASVDSEASWLSGKTGSRMKTRLPASPRRSLGSSYHEELPISEAEAYERIPIPERNPARNHIGGIGTALAAEQHGIGLGLMDLSDEEQVSQGQVTRSNTAVEKGSRVKSIEAVLHQWPTEELATPPLERTSMETVVTEDFPVTHGDTPYLPETPYLENAHARHLSSGSARLLDIPARHDSQRSSLNLSPSPTSPISPRRY